MKNVGAVRGVLIYTMVLNLLVTGVKLAVGYLTGSLSLVASGLDSLFNSTANVVGLVGIQVASRPEDRCHPYGHRKYETLAAASITILLFLTTWQLVQGAIERLREPVVPQVDAWTFAALLISIVVSIYVAWYERRRGKELRSEFLLADALHTQADVFVSLAVGVGLIVVRLGYPAVDAILALVIAVMIARIGITIIRQSSRVLSDAVALEVGQVQEIVTQVPGVQTLHRVRSRGQEDDIHLDLHVRVEPGLAVAQAHEIAHEVEGRLRSAITGLRDVVVHVEPEMGAARAQVDLDRRIRQSAAQVPGTAVHRVRAIDIDGRLYITLHLEVAPSLAVEEAHGLANRLEGLLRADIPEAVDVDIHLEPAEVGNGQASWVDGPTYAAVRLALDEATAAVRGLSDCRDIVVSRQEGQLVVSGHWACAAELSVAEAHALSEALEQQVQERLPRLAQVIVHVEPRAAQP